MRVENYAILLHLTEVNDPEVRQCFQDHLVQQGKHGPFDGDQSLLLSQLTSKTEETYQALLEKHLSNAQYNVIRNKRSMKAESYLDLFRQTIAGGNCNVVALRENLQDYAQ